jgi:PPOX class probable F420-dependent enzyme
MSILDEKYVLLTTFRKNGAGVSTPVWVVKLGEGAGGFTTEVDSGKVKRIRNNPKVTLQACSARGKVQPGSPVVDATAEVVTGSDARPISDAVHRKYWVVANLMKLATVWRKVRRKPEPVDCAVRITLA